VGQTVGRFGRLEEGNVSCVGTLNLEFLLQKYKALLTSYVTRIVAVPSVVPATCSAVPLLWN
jgi:hypothetical protein